MQCGLRAHTVPTSQCALNATDSCALCVLQVRTQERLDDEIEKNAELQAEVNAQRAHTVPDAQCALSTQCHSDR